LSLEELSEKKQKSQYNKGGRPNKGSTSAKIISKKEKVRDCLNYIAIDMKEQ